MAASGPRLYRVQRQEAIKRHHRLHRLERSARASWTAVNGPATGSYPGPRLLVSGKPRAGPSYDPLPGNGCLKQSDRQIAVRVQVPGCQNRPRPASLISPIAICFGQVKPWWQAAPDVVNASRKVRATDDRPGGDHHSRNLLAVCFSPPEHYPFPCRRVLTGSLPTGLKQG
jgi:hypothetical protein